MSHERSELAQLEEENRRLRYLLNTSQDQVVHYAALFAQEAHKNEALTEQVRTSQGQMRIMRKSKTWQAGGVFRLAKRMVGTVVRNIGRMLRP